MGITVNAKGAGKIDLKVDMGSGSVDITTETERKNPVDTRARYLFFPCLFVLIMFAFTANAQTKGPSPTRSSSDLKRSSLPSFSIISTEDLSIKNAVRKSYRVRIAGDISKKDLGAVAEKIVKDACAGQRINAIVIFFYLPESDTSGPFTVGKATWAPDGDWGKASTRATPRLIVETGSALGTVAKEDIVDIPQKEKKRIFSQMVRFEDQGMNSEQSCAAAAKQFRITKEQAGKIAVEGLTKGWPMP